MLHIPSLSTALRPYNRLLLFALLLLLFGSGAYGCFRRRPARITPTRQFRWLPWTAWSPCSVTCGAGRITRHRYCNRGNECYSPQETEIKACVNYHCSDSKSNWTPWSACSASCGPGWMKRSQPCSEKPCREFFQEKKKCNAGACPIDGGVTQWGAWSSCSVTCGLGTETRFRSCTNPPPQFGGADCQKSTVSKRTCSFVVCNTKVHGNWSTWTSWSSCSRTCGVGLKRRSRRCDQPAPAYGGDPCAGKAEENQRCVVAVYCEKPVDGQWNSWHQWTACSERCSKGTRTRLRFCNKPEPKYNGKECPGKAFQTELCTDVCVVHGGWGAWKPINVCRSISDKCDKGVQHLKRKCDNPVPKHGGNPCKGKNIKAMPCWNSHGCPTELQAPADFLTQSFENKTVRVSWRQAPFGVVPTNFEISSKLDSNKSVKTVMVTAEPLKANEPVDGRRYTRLLDLSDISGSVKLWVASLHIRSPTNVQRALSKQHNLVIGEVDGSWSSWDPWSECSVTCGTGMRTRIRRCDSPTRTPKGRPCPGDVQEHSMCDLDFCL